MIFRLLTAAALCAALVLPAAAQPELRLPAPSPGAMVKQTVGVTDVSVEYSSPGVKNRKIFGGLVPLDTLWRTGANAATKITFSEEVSIKGKKVAAGTYAVFTIPGARSWTFILNTNANQGGTGQYDDKLDALRIKVKPAKAAAARERMAFLFENTTDDATDLVLEWDKTRVTVPIKADTATLAQRNVDATLKGASGPLARAARYLAEKKKLDAALSAIDASIAVNQTWFNTWLKASFLAEKGDHKAAFPLAQKAHEMGMKAENFFWKDRVEKAVKEWKSKM